MATTEMPDPVETLRLLVEAAVAVAGFSGVVVVLGRRAAGKWSEVERIYLDNVLVTSLTVLFLSLLMLVLLHAGLEPHAAWRTGSGVWCLICAYQLVKRFRQHLRIAGDDPQRVGNVALAIIYVGTAIMLLGGLANSVAFAEFWPFLAAQVWLFGIACDSFVRLLTFRARSGQAA